MTTASAIRDLIHEIPALDVPRPDAWRYAFIVVGLMIVGLEIAILTEARRLGDPARALTARLVATGTGGIMLLLVVSLYVHVGEQRISALIYPGFFFETVLAIGLFRRFRQYWRHGRFSGPRA